MKKLLLSVLLLFPLFSYAQKEANFWYFGQEAALDFSSGQPLPVNGSKLNTFEGCSSFSDTNGNLLFYVGAPTPNAPGLTIWDRNNNPMLFADTASGGQLLKGNASSSQSALTVPAPGKPDIYYLFTVGGLLGTNPERGFWYYTIDMTKNGGLGDIVDGPTPLNNIFPAGAWTEKVTAVRGSECNTFWVISFVNGVFISYKVDNNGVDINNPVTTNLGTLAYNDVGADASFVNGLDPRGYLKVSPDGKTLVAANMESGTFIFSFNDTTGKVSNPRELNLIENTSSFLSPSNIGYGVEFSQSSEVLYVSTGQASNATEGLFQFDISTTSIEQINSSRFLVESYTNSRGALQLGPDNKIYWASNNSGRISVINNPNRLGDECGFERQVIDLGGKVSTQGLPPFLSSLLLPLEITDPDTGTSINSESLSLCLGDSKTIQTEILTGSTVEYEWTFDPNDGSPITVVSTSDKLEINNLKFENSGTYIATITLTDDCGNSIEKQGFFNLDVFEPATANQNVTDIAFCDTDGDGLNTFDLRTEKDAEILQSLSSSNFTVTYYSDASFKDEIANPSNFTPTSFFNGVIYARVRNNSAPNNVCFADTSFNLSVTGLPVPTQPLDYEVCDDSLDGDDTNGFFENFDLLSKDAEILGSLNTSIYTVSYHLNATDANTGSSPIDKTSLYKNVDKDEQTIYVRVENNENPNCYDANLSFKLIVNPLPVITASVDLRQCDDDLDGFNIFNLEEANELISSNYQNETFAYYKTLSDAENDLDRIVNFTSFNNQVSSKVWVKVFSNELCARISEINLFVTTVNNIPQGPVEIINNCDDNTGLTNSDVDGTTIFDFSYVDPQIKALFPPSEPIVISYYTSKEDAESELNAIQDISNFRNTIANTQLIYVRADNTQDNSCQGISPYIQLNVDEVPTATSVADLELCDDATDGEFDNGIVQSFDLESQTNQILGSQNASDFSVTYHTSQTDATSGNSPIDTSTSYTNIIRDEQTIYVRVENNATKCFNANTSFKLIVNPLPVANFVADLEVCDDDSDGSARNGFSQEINLELQTATILGSQDSSIFTVTYHTSLVGAQGGFDQVIDPTSFDNTDAFRQTVYVRIVNSASNCINGISNFDVIINPEPTFEPISNLSYCDNDSDGDDTSGIITNIDLDSLIPSILGNSQDVDDYTVTFYESKANATSGTSSLQTPFTNTTSGRQTIYVRIENDDTGCFNDDLTFNVIINPLPSFSVTTPQIVCLSGPSLTISAENAATIYDYVWTDPSGNNIAGQDLTITTGGTYLVSATTTNGTGCSRTLEIVVNESEKPTLTRNDVTIVDDSDNNSIKIDTSNLGIGNYEFALVDENGIQTTFQDEPLFEQLSGGIYTLIVQDKNGCKENATLELSVIEFPKFFSPNGDGINDLWKIKGANSALYPNSAITIFNRYGKIVAKIQLDGPGWDGTFNGNTLPSDDYWFLVELYNPDGTSRLKDGPRRGNFSLLRR